MTVKSFIGLAPGFCLYVEKVMRINPTNKFYSHASNINNCLTKAPFATLGVTLVQNVA
jgi:hypothetical protein